MVCPLVKYIFSKSKQDSFGIFGFNNDFTYRPAAIIDPVEVPPDMPKSKAGLNFDLIEISSKITTGIMPRIPPPSMLRMFIFFGRV